MPGRLRELSARLTYARVVAALAILLIAVGGGYSLAFSGSGTLQKANKVGFTSGGNDVIRAIGGIGPLSANCVNGADLQAQVENTLAGKDLWAYTDRFDTSDLVFPVSTTTIPAGGDDGVQQVPAGTAGVLRVHLFPTNGDKQPQAKLTIGLVNTGTCSTSQVSVLNLTTEG